MSKYKLSKSKLGDIFRELRLQEKLPLRKVAALLDIDVAILSKLERGERRLTKELVVKLAEIYHQELEPLMIQYLSERVLYEIEGEQLAAEAMKVAEGEIMYKVKTRGVQKGFLSKEKIMMLFHDYLDKQSLVKKAWLFGSMARGDNTATSDIDIVIDVYPNQPFTFFDLAEIQENFSSIAHKKTDVVMLNGLRPAMKSRIEKEMILFYEAG